MKLPNVSPHADVYAQLIKVAIFLGFSLFIFWNYVVTPDNAFALDGSLKPFYSSILAIFAGTMVIHFALNLLGIIRALRRLNKTLR